MANYYDNAAPFYDQLSRLVFGRALVEAQLYLLSFVPPNANILIVGGGTGWILEELAKLHPDALRITYVEISAKMMALSQKRKTGANQVRFINSAIQDVELDHRFNIVITPFLFDNFSQSTANKVFTSLHSALMPGGLWLCTDFEPTGKWWQGLLLKAMQLFFKILCRIETWRLPDIKGLFAQNNYQVVRYKRFFGDFINSSLYQKPL